MTVVAIREKFVSRSPHGERGLKSDLRFGRFAPVRRSPHGERGLKFFWGGLSFAVSMSLPSRGAWIEICMFVVEYLVSLGRSPHGERGLKSPLGMGVGGGVSVAPLTGSVD